MDESLIWMNDTSFVCWNIGNSLKNLSWEYFLYEKMCTIYCKMEKHSRRQQVQHNPNHVKICMIIYITYIYYMC